MTQRVTLRMSSAPWMSPTYEWTGDEPLQVGDQVLVHFWDGEEVGEVASTESSYDGAAKRIIRKVGG